MDKKKAELGFIHRFIPPNKEKSEATRKNPKTTLLLLHGTGGNEVQQASKVYGFDLQHLLGIGYSNGANIAASCLLLQPGVLSDAILFRPMVPLVPDPLPQLSSKRILISAGLHDPVVQRQETENLLTLLKKAGADVSINWQNSGHELILEEVRIAKNWLRY